MTIGPGATVDLGYGRVVVQARLGEGGMGVVWRAWLFFAPSGPRAREAPVPLALKVLHARGSASPALRALFVNEAEALRRLSHPNIVAFQDFFPWEGALVLAMELVDGVTLEDVLSRHRARSRLAGATDGAPMERARAWYYFQQLLGALAATHALGFVHRDVKPSNILIRRDGIVKLGDFGIAGLLGAATHAPSTPDALPFGTGAYMSPEQVQSRPVDARSDLYSAAIVLYEMLAGRPPFSPDDLDEMSLRLAQVRNPPPPIGLFAPSALALEPILARALAKEPRYRFGSALELGHALLVALGEPESAAWHAQGELASEAAAPSVEADVHEAKLATLREFVVQSYREANPGG